MSHNRFGTLFNITTWGESHGPQIGVVIDGCPAGLHLRLERINAALARRAPGQTPYTTPRTEQDTARIVSGVFNETTTGAPISIIIDNTNADSSKYDAIKDMYRPGHANFTYLHKYGIFDHRGGGRASARETAARVAAGAVADCLLEQYHITVTGYLESMGSVNASIPEDTNELRHMLEQSAIFAPDPHAEEKMIAALLQAVDDKDSLGGIVGFRAEGMPAGLGEPVYGKIDAVLAAALMSIPAAKGVEFGTGFQAAQLTGSHNNDIFAVDKEKVITLTNNAGGMLGGITTGMPLWGKVAFKPTASIMQAQQTVTTQQEHTTFHLPEGSRHDPCVAIRAVPVVEAMLKLVLADALLLHTARAKV